MSTQTIDQRGSRVQPTTMNQPPQGQQSLARIGSTALEPTIESISDPRVLVSKIEELRDSFNIIAPPVQVMGGFTPGYALTASLVAINTTVNEDGQGAETYVDKGFMKPGQRALNRVGLAKVASAAGVKWTPNCGRRDDSKTPNKWEYYAEGLVDTPDGQYQVITGTVEIDLTDGSPQIGGWTPDGWNALMKSNEGKPRDEKKWSINGWSDKRVQQARTRGLALAETKAKNRATRSIGLQQVYTEAELKKPFLIFKATYQPDMTDPVVRQMVAHRALHGRQMLYPSMASVNATPMLAAPVPPAGTLDTTTTSQAEAPAEPKPVTFTSVARIGSSNGEDVYEIKISDGRAGRTADKGVIEGAKKACELKTPVDPLLQSSERVQGVLVLIGFDVIKSADADLY